MEDQVVSIYALLVETDINKKKEVSVEELEKYFNNCNDLVSEYIKRRKKSYKESLKELKKKVLLSKLKMEKKNDFLACSVEYINELNDKVNGDYQTLVEYGEYCKKKPTKEGLTIYKAYRKYCTSVDNLTNKLSVDVLKANSNRGAFTYMIDADTEFIEIEEKAKDLKDHVRQIINQDKTRAKKLVK